MANPSTLNNPFALTLITADDVRGDPENFAALINARFQNISQALNALQGAAGTINLSSHLDLQGNSIKNVAPPSGPHDVVTQSSADAAYSATVLAPQIEANGPVPLQTYRQINNPTQHELSTSFLNSLGNTSPDTNSSDVTFGPLSGGFIPVTISSGVASRADGSTLVYAQFNDSVSQPGTFNIATISRTANVVTGTTVGINNLLTGETVQIAGVTDPGFNGSPVLSFVGIGGSPPGPIFQYNQAGADLASSGGTVSLFGVYYYVMNPPIGKIFRIGPFAADTTQNRLNAAKDGLTLIAVAVVTGEGGNVENSAAGATSPNQNIGGGNRLLSL